MEHILLNAHLSKNKKKNLGRSPKPRAPARYEGESSAKLFQSEEPGAGLPTEVMCRVTRSARGVKKL